MTARDKYPEIIYATEKVGTNEIRCLDYKNYDEDVKYIRLDKANAYVKEEVEMAFEAGQQLGKNNYYLHKNCKEAKEEYIKSIEPLQ